MEQRGRRRRRITVQQRSKGKEDDRLQVHGVNPHLCSHMIPPLHKAYRQMDEQTDGEEGGRHGQCLRGEMKTEGLRHETMAENVC